MRKSIACMIDWATAARWLILWTVWLWGPASLLHLCAEDTSRPSWQQGISAWNGSGYDLPTNQFQSTNLDAAAQFGSTPFTPVQITPVQIGPVATANTTPYVMPTDPSAPRINPYVDLDKKNDNAPMQMSVPYITSNPSPAITFAPPENAAKHDEPNTPIQFPAPIPLPKRLPKPAQPEPMPTQDFEELPAPESGPSAIPAKQEPAAAADPETPKSPAPADTKNGEQNRNGGDAENVVAPEAVVEAAPLQNEVIRWYQYPRRWMRGWDSHAELGLDGSDGNADTLAIQTGLELKRKTETYTLAIDVDYRQASSRNVTTEDNGRLNVDYDRMLNGTPWSAFGKLGLEWDKFKPFTLRPYLNGGVGYYWLRQDDVNFVTRFGAGASQDIGAPNDDWVAEALFGFDADKQVNSRNKLKAKVDYYPAWEDFSNYRMVADFAWEILLDDSDNLSLKLAATDRYDSTPQGAKPNDVYYSLLLLYKF